MKKICTKCKELKDLSEFYKRKNSINDYRKECKECILIKRKQYQIDNKEKITKRKRQYQISNKESIAKKAKQYNIDNKEKIAKQRKQYYDDNTEKFTLVRKKRKAQMDQYYQDNKERIAIRDKQYRINNKEEISIRSKQRNNINATYEVFKDKLTTDEAPRLAKNGTSLEVKCRYCGKYFIPYMAQTYRRIQSLLGQVLGEQSLYCSDHCKQACPIYKKVLYPKGFKPASSREVNPLVRQMCFERDNWRCQICGATQKEAPLHCHHIEGYAQNPRLGNDVANTITLCKTCHKEVHKLPGCNYHELQCIRD
jgi:hypothetical protein